MKLKKHLSDLLKVLICMVFVASAIELRAQDGTAITVSGTVVDVAGLPIIGAVVIDPTQTSNGCITDVDGNFTMQAAVGKELKVSSIGYQEYRFKVLQRSQKYRIVLQENNVELDEVVVVGYGVQKKVTMTGAVSAIQNKEIITTKNENLQNMLTGKVPGLRIVQNTSEPGQFTNKMDIRGFGTPLVVIDGVPRDNMAKIDAEDIESISVLKDASAAVYGVRAANGVILITTKKGGKGNANVSYSGHMTWQVPTNFPDLVEAADIMMLVNEKVIHNVDESANRTYSLDEIADYRNGVKRGTNWKNEIFRNSAPQTQHNINISGGGDKVTYFASAGYQYQESYLRSNAINYEKFNLRSNLSAKVTDNLKLDLNLSGMMDERASSPANSSAIIYEGWLSSPLESVWYDEEKGMYASRLNPAGYNPKALMDTDLTGHCTYKSKWFQSNASLTWDIPWVKGLSLSGMYSFDYIANNDDEYRKAYNLYDKSGNAIIKSSQTAAPNKISRYFYEKQNNLWQARLNYSNNFGKHDIGVLVLLENQHKVGDNFYGSRQVALDMDKVFAGITTNQEFNQNADQGVLYDNANRALVGRLNYDYAGKYIAEFAFRYEGSSLFPKDTRWGFFPSVSAGYRISEEKFWKESPLNFINNFKVRASWGVLGDDSAARYQHITGYRYPSDGGSVFNGQYIGTSASTGIPNKAITWYESRTFNIGVDAEAWNGLLGITAEYFNRERSGLLTTRAGSLPGVVGATLPQENLNGDRTQGFEIEISHRNNIHDFFYQIKGNIAYTRTKNTHIETSRAGNSYENWRNNTNNRYNNITWGVEGAGRLENWNEVWHNPIFIARGSVLGDYEYLDWNGDGVFSELDKHPLVNSSSVPLLNFGFTLSAQWKGIDISMLLQGAGKTYVSPQGILYQPLWGDGAVAQYMDRWHPEDPLANPYDPSTKWIKGHYAYTGTLPDQSSGFHLQNASYVRLKNLEIGYSLPDKWLKSAKMQGVRVYFSGYNLLTFTGLKYLDPEYSADTAYAYPISKTFTLGLNFKF